MWTFPPKEKKKKGGWREGKSRVLFKEMCWERVEMYTLSMRLLFQVSQNENYSK